jgi:acetoacetyl-CoA reductase/3-oxoacyl-[acyl-carrier protein] reductase
MATTQEHSKVAREGDRLAGRVALVTGGTRGIGAAICRALARQGANIAAGYSRDAESAERLTADLAEAKVETSTHQGNIGSAEDCRRTVQEVLDRHGRLDILVNNAGITADKTILKMADEDWQKVLDVNLSGAFFMSKAAFEHMLERGTGRIINISSLIGETGGIGQVNYAAAKAGLFGMTKTFAKEAAFQLQRAGKLENNHVGITVNAVAPGYTATDMLSTVPEKVIDSLRAQIPLKRLGEPDEVARAVYFLAGDEAGYVTGQVIDVNGGLDM